MNTLLLAGTYKVKKFQIKDFFALSKTPSLEVAKNQIIRSLEKDQILPEKIDAHLHDMICKVNLTNVYDSKKIHKLKI